jgi:hypothetical protein
MLVTPAERMRLASLCLPQKAARKTGRRSEVDDMAVTRELAPTAEGLATAHAVHLHFREWASPVRDAGRMNAFLHEMGV